MTRTRHEAHRQPEAATGAPALTSESAALCRSLSGAAAASTGPGRPFELSESDLKCWIRVARTESATDLIIRVAIILVIAVAAHQPRRLEHSRRPAIQHAAVAPEHLLAATLRSDRPMRPTRSSEHAVRGSGPASPGFSCLSNTTRAKPPALNTAPT